MELVLLSCLGLCSAPFVTLRESFSCTVGTELEAWMDFPLVVAFVFLVLGSLFVSFFSFVLGLFGFFFTCPSVFFLVISFALKVLDTDWRADMLFLLRVT
uniref:Uncharacterized protein n=1 Tax=Cacopsylla melanoneura TaxID=428564 RepID=A0A8D8QLC6_9HEMI